MNFIDKVQIKVIAGKGGNGKVSFHRVIYNPKGGPDGGDGGHGGNIVFKASNNQNTLSRYRYLKEIKAKDGGNGSVNRRHGKNGEDFIALVPVGTQIVDAAGQILADLTFDGQSEVIALGGHGGFGNAHFVSSRRKAPNFAEQGEPGQLSEITLELKMIADVGLVGLPNAGKSTFLSRVSHAHPTIADYPFTTLVPNLGVADIDENTSILIADIPGLISGAAEGKGLGHDFLRHIERTAVILHIIDSYSDDIVRDYQTIRSELKAYNPKLIKRPEVIALSKIDGLDKQVITKQIDKLKKHTKSKIYAISSLRGDNLKQLLFELNKLVQKQNTKTAAIEDIKEELEVITLHNPNEKWHVRKHKNKFIVTGLKIESMAIRTDFTNDEAMYRLKDIMRRQGITHELIRRKIKAGQIIQFGDNEDKQIEY